MRVVIIKEVPDSPTFRYRVGDQVTTDSETGRHWIKQELAREDFILKENGGETVKKPRKRGNGYGLPG
jgi:hypothetical protein